MAKKWNSSSCWQNKGREENLCNKEERNPYLDDHFQNPWKICALSKLIASDFSHIGKRTLSWMGRAAAFKMLTLPKLLYCFRAIPIQIPRRNFCTMDAVIRRFIWKGNKLCIAYSTLRKYKSRGGIGLPNLCNYYYSAPLDQIKECLIPSDKQWVNIERAMIVNHDLKSLLLADFHP